METKDIFAKRFNEALRDNNLKQSDIVNRLGLNRGAVSCYANGSYMPKSFTLTKIAQMLNVSPSWLAGLSSEKYDRNVIVGEKMKRRRLDLGLSLKDVAEALGYHNEFSIDKIEKAVNPLSIAELCKVAEVLQCSTDYLLGFQNNDTSKFTMTDKEKCIVLSYRAKPDLQKAIDTLLGL
jgi:Helix-turn-helix.